MLEESDLSEMGVTKPDHLKIILEASNKIPPLKPIGKKCYKHVTNP